MSSEKLYSKKNEKIIEAQVGIMKTISLLVAVIFIVHSIAIAMPTDCCSYQKGTHEEKTCRCNAMDSHGQCDTENTIHTRCDCHCSISPESATVSSKAKNVIITKTPDINKSNELIHHLNIGIAELLIHFPNKRLNPAKIPLFRPLRI